MTPFFPAILFSFLLANLAAAQSRDPVALIPARFRWVSPPNNPALQAAWIIGSEEKRGPYILRVRLAAGGRIPPHTHPDERNSTVLAGTISVGFGEVFDEAKMVAMPTGRRLCHPSQASRTISGQGKQTRSIRKPASDRRGHFSSAIGEILVKTEAEFTLPWLHHKDSPLPFRFA